MTTRVLYATPFWHERSGPEESLLAFLTSAPAQRLLDPVVAMPAHAAYRARFEAAGITVVPFAADLLRRTVQPRALAAWVGSVRRARQEAAALLTRVRPEVAHSNMESSLGLALAARGAGVPHVHHVRSISIARPRPAAAALVATLRRTSAARIAISRQVAAIFPAIDQPEVIDNPVDDALFSLTRAASTDLPTVLALGRVNARKDLLTFLDVAAATTAPARFRIVGPVADEDRRYEALLRRRIADLGLEQRVELHPPIPADEALGAADVLLNAGGDEGFGRVVAEAMAAGVPVVGRRAGATVELVEDGRTGRLFGSVAEGAVALDHVLGDPVATRRLVEAARAAAEARFRPAAVAEQVLGVYRRVAPDADLG